jgi:Fe-S-cluster containining protein
MVIPPINTEKGKSFIALRKVEGGKCLFFNSETKKCRIYSIRPCFCRTFPFSYISTQNNKIRVLLTEKGKEYCPGLNEHAPLINIDQWISLGIKALKELETNAKFVIEWNEREKKPTAKKFLEKLD